MKVIITGSKGQVGRELLRLAPSNLDIYAFDSIHLDITNHKKVRRVIQEIRPDFLINAAAYTAVDLAENEADFAFKVNSHAVQNLASEMNNINGILIHISTDYVFSGTKLGIYNENDEPDPESIYGQSKLEGEKSIIESISKYIIVRTSWVYSPYGKNFLTTMLKLAKKIQELEVVSDQIGSPTSARSIAETIYVIINFINKNQFQSGIYNYSGQPYMSWYDFAKDILERSQNIKILEEKVIVNPILTSEYEFKAPRPLNSRLDNTKILSSFGINHDHYSESLDLALNEIKKSSL